MVEQSLQIKLTQKLALAPQLQQAIRLLQLTRLELRDYIQEAVDANPLLEQVEPGDDGGDVRHQMSAAASMATVAKKPTAQMAERRYMIPLA